MWYMQEVNDLGGRIRFLLHLYFLLFHIIKMRFHPAYI